jgi:hypothetical protein
MQRNSAGVAGAEALLAARQCNASMQDHHSLPEAELPAAPARRHRRAREVVHS